MDITATAAAATTAGVGVGTDVMNSIITTTTTATNTTTTTATAANSITITTTTTNHTFLITHILHSVVTDHRLIGVDDPMYGCNDARRNITQAGKMQIVVYTYILGGGRDVLRMCYRCIVVVLRVCQWVCYRYVAL